MVKKVSILGLVGILLIVSVIFTGCTQNDGNIQSEYKTSSVFEEKTEEELQREQAYREELNRANEERSHYKYRFGNSDAYQTTRAINRAGNEVDVFLQPEQALQQSFEDYKDAYTYVSQTSHMSIPESGDLEKIKEFAHFSHQTYIEDNATLTLECKYLSMLLYTYTNTYFKADMNE